MDANLQILSAKRKTTSYFYWCDAVTAQDLDLGIPEGTGAWITEDYALPDTDVPLVPGDGVQIDAEENKGIVSAGEVDDSDVTFTTRAGYNFVGNAFPMTLNIQDIQLDASVNAMDANLQILSEKRKTTAYYYWCDAATAKDLDLGVADGKGAWITEDYALPETAEILSAGEGVQVDAPEGKTITILSPIEI